MAVGASTGTCAAAAAKAAAMHSQGAKVPRFLEVPLPGGHRLDVELLAWGGRSRHPWASVRKPMTADPDATRDAVVVATLEPSEELVFHAGAGVGTVTRPGLQLPVGEPAINPGPRAQIEAALAEIGSDSWKVTISVLGGAGIARRTFNGRLGIIGGISILGTTGLVRPWSTEAFLASVDAHLGVVRAKGQKTLILVPGHMGEKAAGRFLSDLECVEVGNAWGAVLDLATRRDFEEIVALGHPGKLVKIAQGQWNTHSSMGSSAASWVLRFLRRTGRFDSTRVDDPTWRPDTLEELLAGFDTETSKTVAALLASRVALRITRRSGKRSRALFIDLKGNFLGEGSS